MWWEPNEQAALLAGKIGRKERQSKQNWPHQ